MCVSYLPSNVNAEKCQQHEALHDDRTGSGDFGVITVRVENWAPKNARSCPPSLTDGMSAELSIQFALAYNASEHAAQRKRWALVTHSGTILILTGLEDRPSDPAAFPGSVVRVHTLAEANRVMELENGERHRHAKIPREWCIAVRPLAISAESELSALKECVLRQGATIKGLQDRLNGSAVTA